MAFPKDLEDVKVFKIHPAIGVARLANNDDFYEFFDYQRLFNAPECKLEYMSKHNGHKTIKRQAVQFKIFAYNEKGDELGELNKETMLRLKVDATWRAQICNRKLNYRSKGTTPEIRADGSASGAEKKPLKGDNPWENSKNCKRSKIWLGELTGTGLFIPPKGGVYRQDRYKTIPKMVDGWDKDNGVQDTTSDGEISVTLKKKDQKIPQKVIPAAVVVAPQQHSPDVYPEDLSGHNQDFAQATRELLGIKEDKEPIGKGYAMDFAMMRTIAGEYSPGMEVCLEKGAPYYEGDPKEAFYAPDKGDIDALEIRPRYGDGHAKYGALTAGLCSAWQTDLNLCLEYWTAQYPEFVYYKEGKKERFLTRRIFIDRGPQEDDPEFLNKYIDRMDIGRNLDGDVEEVRGTEREGDMGATPGTPFPLEPEQ